MDDAALSFEIDLAADEAEFVHRAAEQSVHGPDGDQDDRSFVMITTEVRDGRMVKVVVFDRLEAARRFKTLLPEATPKYRGHI